jgi:uncharacterized membrane protein
VPKKVKDKILPFEPQAAPELLFRKIHSVEGKFASFVSSFSGNMWFVYLHVAWFTFWILANNGDIPGIKPFDPFPYGLLTMVVSLEAIFLATFILINQNRQALVDTYRDIKFEEFGEAQQEELEEDVEDIQKDIDDIKNAMSFIQGKLNQVEKAKTEGNGNGSEHR